MNMAERPPERVHPVGLARLREDTSWQPPTAVPYPPPNPERRAALRATADAQSALARSHLRRTRTHPPAPSYLEATERWHAALPPGDVLTDAEGDYELPREVELALARFSLRNPDLEPPAITTTGTSTHVEVPEESEDEWMDAVAWAQRAVEAEERAAAERAARRGHHVTRLHR